MTKKGQLYIISAPSGAGKTSLINAMLKKHSGIEISVSYTTRQIRDGEQDGVHYHFITEEEFQKKIADGEFLEHAEVFGNHYGTCRDAVLKKLETGIDVLLEIDYQGAAQTRHKIDDTISIFILPPSLKELKTRLEVRGQDNPEVVEMRLKGAKDEISSYAEFEHLLMNQNFDETLERLQNIIFGGSQEFTVEKQKSHYLSAIDEMMSIPQ